MPAPSNIQSITHAGHACLRLSTRHGTAIIALQGAQVLSWVPTGHRDVFWLSPISRPAPAAIRGGVPICWPWFGKQAMPEGAMQHGPVRNLSWGVVSVLADSADRIDLILAPCRTGTPDDPLARFAPQLDVSLQLVLGQSLELNLQTRNLGAQPFALIQALHSYFAVHDATQVQVTALADLHFDDKLSGASQQVQPGPFRLDQACDRIYYQQSAEPEYHYTLEDAKGQRRIQITTQGSQSLVVWNPGEEGARNMTDVPDAAWREFMCLETANAGTDAVMLAPGAQHRLTQMLTVTPWPADRQ